MKRIDTANRQLDKFGPGKDGFRAAVPGVSDATYLSAKFCESVQESIVRVIEGAELVPSDDHDQLIDAVQALIFAGNGGGNVIDSIDALHLVDYAALRDYGGVQKSVYITGYFTTAHPSGIAGVFVRDDSDVTTADNNGTTIVGYDGGRWKRVFSGPAAVTWFGADPTGVGDSTSAIQAAHNAHRVVYYPESVAYYKTTGTITLQPGSKMVGEARVEGNDTTVSIKYAGAAGGKMFACDSVDSAKGIIAEGLVLDGGGLAATAFSLNTYRSRITSITAKNFTGTIISFVDSAVWAGENRVEGCTLQHGVTGVKAGNSGYDGFLVDNVIYACTNHVDLASDGGWLVRGNHFYSSGVASPAYVTIRSAAGGRILDNVFDTPPTNGISFTISVSYACTVLSGNVFTAVASTLNFVTISVPGGGGKLSITGNTFFVPTGGALTYCIQKSGAGSLLGTVGSNMYVNVADAKKYLLDAGTIVFDPDGGTLFTKLDSIQMRYIKISQGFGSPGAVPQVGSIYSAYNTNVNADKGPLFFSYEGAWKKVPTLDRWHIDSLVVPSTGDWNQGDTVYNEAPTELGAAGSKYIITGWKCVASGTPGTWVQMRSLTGN